MRRSWRQILFGAVICGVPLLYGEYAPALPHDHKDGKRREGLGRRLAGEIPQLRKVGLGDGHGMGEGLGQGMED